MQDLLKCLCQMTSLQDFVFHMLGMLTSVSKQTIKMKRGYVQCRDPSSCTKGAVVDFLEPSLISFLCFCNHAVLLIRRSEQAHSRVEAADLPCSMHPPSSTQALGGQVSISPCQASGGVGLPWISVQIGRVCVLIPGCCNTHWLGVSRWCPCNL